MACACGTCLSCAAASAAMAPGIPPVPARGCISRPRLAQRLAPLVDRLRQRNSDFGLRPYLVYMCWTRWTGAERGEGYERNLRAVPILPTPKVEDLTSLALSPFAAGILPVGSVRISEITQRLSAENLAGNIIPPQAYLAACGFRTSGVEQSPEAAAMTAKQSIGHSPHRSPEHVPEPNSFFYEVVEDVPNAQRSKFRLVGVPFRRPGKGDWTLVLERIGEDRDRTGRSQAGVDPEFR